MDTRWTIISGGRLGNNHPTDKISYALAFDGKFEKILLKNETTKRSFEEKLHNELSAKNINASSQPALIIEYSSMTYAYPFSESYVEFTLTVKEVATDSVLWYFVLLSPVGFISTSNLNEIIWIIANRVPLK
jgi:hypothetical protein